MFISKDSGLFDDEPSGPPRGGEPQKDGYREFYNNSGGGGGDGDAWGQQQRRVPTPQANIGAIGAGGRAGGTASSGGPLPRGPGGGGIGSGSGYAAPGGGEEAFGPGEGGDVGVAPSSAANLRAKMMQQQRLMMQRRSSASGAGMMVQATASPVSAPPVGGTSQAGQTSQVRKTSFGQGVLGPTSTPTGMMNRPMSGASGGSTTFGSSSIGSSGGTDGASDSHSQGRDSLQSRGSMCSELGDMSGVVMPSPGEEGGGPIKEDESVVDERKANLAQELKERGIMPVFDPTPLNPSPASQIDQRALDFSDMRSFLMSPAPKGAMFECRIIRDKSGLAKFFPKYTFETDQGRFLLASKKQTSNKTSNYYVSMSPGEVSSKKDEDHLGKLRSNFLGSEFTAYSMGLNPNKIDKNMPQASAMQVVRQELLGVSYSSTLWGKKPRGPRKMSVVIPHVQPNGERIICKSFDQDQDGLLALSKSGGQGRTVDCYQNKPPKWNDQVGAFVLNFNKRVTQASVKNFQLISVDDPDTVFLQFGRVGKDVFNIDFRFPLSPFQAFTICLSSFDYKLCCE